MFVYLFVCLFVILQAGTDLNWISRYSHGGKELR